MSGPPTFPPMTIEAARAILASDPTWRATRDERERELLEHLGDPASVAERMHMWSETQARQVQGGPAILARRRNLPQDFPPADLPPPILRPDAIPPSILRDSVDLATRDSEADPAAVLATMLTRFAAEIGSGPHYMVGETRHPARLFMLIVGSTSKARKGTSAAPVRALWNGSGLTVTPGPVSSGEGIIWAVRDPIRQWKPDKNGAGGQWITTDPGAEDKRLLIQTEEVASAFKAMKREGNTASTTLRELWDRGSAAPLTKTCPTRTTGAHVNLLGHITGEELTATLPALEGFTGLLNRFLLVYARRQRLIPHPAPMDEREAETIRHQLIRLAEQARTVGRLTMTDAARDLWTAVYPELSADGYGLTGAITNRAEAQATRLAVVYALLDGCREIDHPHLTAALAFWEYCEQTACYLFSGQAADPIQARILDGLKSGPLSATEISTRIFGRHLDAAKLTAALTALTDAGAILATTIPTSGRPRKVFVLRPCEKSEESEESPHNSLNSLLSPSHTDTHRPHNSLNSLLSPSHNENDPPPLTDAEKPAWLEEAEADQ
jgi:hypothetical protein